MSITVDDQARNRIAEILRNAVATLYKHRGLPSTPWDKLTDVERTQYMQQFDFQVGNDNYALLEATEEGQRLEAAIIGALLPTMGVGLRVIVQPSTEADGVAISPAIMVAIVNGAGEVLTDRTDDIVVDLAPAGAEVGALTGTVTQPAVAGVATFDDLEVDDEGTYTLLFGAAGLAGVQSAQFVIT